MQALLNLQAVMFLEMSAGFIVRKLNIVKGESKGILTALIVYITLPCNIVLKRLKKNRWHDNY